MRAEIKLKDQKNIVMFQDKEGTDLLQLRIDWDDKTQKLTVWGISSKVVKKMKIGEII